MLNPSFFFRWIILLTICTNLSEQYRLNVPRVLLPYHPNIPVYFVLEVTHPTGGCFNWRSTRPDVVSVKSLSNTSSSTCSDRAEIRSVVKSDAIGLTDTSSVIFAEDRASGTTLSCGVTVDQISTISIETTTKVLFVDAAPARMIVDAFNAEGDRFSTLSEISLEWELLSTSNSVARKPLRIVPFEQSTYEAPDEIVKLEKNRKRGSLILIEGVGTGQSSLIAKFSDSYLKNVKAHKVDLIVVANLLLVPSQDMYIPVHSILPFQVLLVKQHGTQVVPMPSENYELTVDSEKIISFDRSTTSIRALTRGNAGVSLVNSHIDVETKAGLRPPSTNIHVVDVETIQWYVTGDNWILETGRQYTFNIEMFDENRNSMFLSDNIVFDTLFDETLFSIDFISKNKTWITATPLKPSTTILSTKFVGLKDTSSGKLLEQVRKISGEQKVTLVEPLKIVPSVVYLPYVAASKKSAEILLLATGGSGVLSWAIENSQIASVDATGRVVANNLGSTSVRVTDLRNQALTAQAEVHVLDVNDLAFGETVRETFVGQDLKLNLRVFGHGNEKKNEMSDCRHIDFGVEVVDATVLRHSKDVLSTLPTIGTGCGTITLRGLKAGDTRVTVSVGPYKATLDVAVYNALTVQDEELSIGLESNHLAQLIGGPRPWLLDTSTFFRTETGSSKIAINFDDNNVIVKCSAKETSETVVLQIGNEVSSTLPFPLKSEISLKICCTPPTRLEIFEKRQKLDKCPNNIHTIKSRSSTKLFLRGHGVCLGKMTRLHSINGIKTKWTSSDKNILKVGSPSTHEAAVYAEVSSLHHGVAAISASLVSNSKTDVVVKYEMLVFDEMRSEPNHMTLWNEAVAEGRFQIAGGSGIFTVENTPNAMSQVKLAMNGRTLSVSPKKDGSVNLRIVDQCVAEQYVDVNVKIVEIKSLKIVAPQYVEIGQEVEIECIAQDDNGNTIKNTHLPLKQAVLDASNNNVLLKRNDGLTWSARADVIGTVSLSVSATTSAGRQLHSKPHTLQVFAPIYLQPKRLTLIPESYFQLEVVGGPQPTPPLSFTLNTSSLVEIQPNALIKSKDLGCTEIVGTVLVGDGHVTKDSVVVRVVSLGGIGLFASTRKVEVGGRIDVRLKGIVAGANENEEPFAFGGASYPFDVVWTVSDPTIIQTVHPLGAEYSEPEFNRFAVWFDATRSGTVTIKATVKLHKMAYKHFAGSDRQFEAQIDVHVEDSISLVAPEMKLNTIRIAPNSHLKLTTSWPNTHFSVPTEYATKLSVTQEGLIHTFGKEGSAIITAKRVDSSDNETAIVPVAVSRVYSLDVVPTAELRNTFGTSPLSHLPVGAQIQLKVIPRDVRGRVLSSTSSNINYRPHRFDLTDIIASDNNHTLTITLKSAGDTVLRICDASNEFIATFIRISASESLLPQAAFKYHTDLVVSDVFCLKSDLLSDDGLRWSSKSSNEAVLNWLDGVAGVVQLRQAGDTFIKLESGKQTIHSKIIINSPQALRFTPRSSQIVTNEKSARFVFPVIAASNSTTLRKNSSIYGNCRDEQVASFANAFIPIACHVAFVRGDNNNERYPALNWLTAHAIFVESVGYACEVRRLEAGVSGIPEELERQQWNVEVVAKWIESERRVVADASISVPFHFAVIVEESEIVLSNVVDTSGVLSIWAPRYDAKHIAVRGCDGDIISVAKRSKSATASPTKSNIFYDIKLNVKSAALFSDHAKKCHVTVENTKTGQVVRVPISIQLLDETAKNVYNALETRGMMDVLFVMFKQNSGIFAKMLWTCAIAIIIIIVGIYMKMNINEKSGSFGDTTMNSTAHQTSIASSMSSTANSSTFFHDMPPVFRSTPIAGSPNVSVQAPRDRVRAHLGSAGDRKLWTTDRR